ncbi:MAG: restriction endonuclease subunit S [Kiritimatiellae bacterium]|nr:restriction endonuclease subunit S [Kiritimatiellia bacterium]
MTPQELKNSILQLAIQGKLVDQRPEEGTAAELLDKILATKNAKSAKKNLTRSRGARGEKETSALSASPREKILDDEKPFDIPESWEWCLVGDVFNHNTGKAMNSSAKATPKSGTVRKFITTSNVYWNSFDLTSLKEMFFSDDELERCSAKKNAILMCEGGAYYGRAAIWKNDYDICFQNHIHRLRPYVPICEEFFYYVFFFYRNNGMMKPKGTAMPGLSSIALHNLPIPLPPLAEQKRIVVKIEELLPLIDRYEKAWSRLEDFNKRFPVDMQKSLLQMAIQGKLVEQRPEEGTGEELYRQIQAEKQRLIKSGKIKKEKLLPEITEDEIPFEIPESWKWVRLGELCSIATGRRDANFGSPDGKYNFFTCAKNPIKCHSFSFTGESLLLAGNGDIGNITYFWGQFEAYQRTYVLQPYLEGSYLIYLYYHLQSNWVQYNTGMVYGTAIPYIRLGNVQNYLVALPPLAEQKRIVAKLEELLPLCERLK